MTLLELLLAVLLFGLVSAAVVSVMSTVFLSTANALAKLEVQKEALYSLRHITREVQRSAYTQIAGATLTLYNRDGTSRAVYTHTPATGLLTYTPTGGASETISRKITSLVLDDARTPNNTSGIKILKFQLTSTEPVLPNISATLYTSAWSRVDAIPKSVRNVSTTPPTSYATIQAAIEAATPGDEIRVMGAVPGFSGLFTENLTINKSLTLKGSYDADFTTQDYANTPTTLDGQGNDGVAVGDSGGQPPTLTIDGFVIRNSQDALYAMSEGMDLTIAQCTLRENKRAIYANAIWTGHSISIRNSIIENNLVEITDLHDADRAKPAIVVLRSVSSLVLDGVIVRNNVFRSSDFQTTTQGGILMILGGVKDVSFLNTTVENNTVDVGKYSGGILLFGGSSLLTMDNCLIKNNTVTSQRGMSDSGIISNIEYTLILAGSTITRTELSNNTISNPDPYESSRSHILQFSGVDSLSIEESAIENNTMSSAGHNCLVFRLGSVPAGKSLRISRSRISGNTISPGGHYNAIVGIGSVDGTFSIEQDSSISDNTVMTYGSFYSGIVSAGVGFSGTFSLDGSSVGGNHLGAPTPLSTDAAVLHFPNSSGNILITNSDLSGNSLANLWSYSSIIRHTGALWHSFSIENSNITGNVMQGVSGADIVAAAEVRPGRTFQIVNCNIAGNSSLDATGAPFPRRVVNISNLRGTSPARFIANTIIYSNTGVNAASPIYPSTLSVVYSDLQGSAVYPGTGNINSDPLFVDSASGDFHLQAGSPCVDAGDPAADSNDPDGTPNDMGAYGGPGAAGGVGPQP